LPILQIEHPVRDYDTWKAAFDSDPAGRSMGGVRRYEICRPVEDPTYVAVDLVFDNRDEAEAFKLGLEAVWRSPQAGRALGGAPKARIVDMVERMELPPGVVRAPR
jgi:hypothetical protein